MAKCKNCGKEINDPNAAFCIYCGNALSNTDAAADKAPASPDSKSETVSASTATASPEINPKPVQVAVTPAAKPKPVQVAATPAEKPKPVSAPTVKAGVTGKKPSSLKKSCQ